MTTNDNNEPQNEQRGMASLALDHGLIATLRIRLARVRLEIDRVEQAVHDGDDLTSRGRSKLDSLRQEAAALEDKVFSIETDQRDETVIPAEELDETAAPSPPTTAPPTAAPPTASPPTASPPTAESIPLEAFENEPPREIRQPDPVIHDATPAPASGVAEQRSSTPENESAPSAAETPRVSPSAEFRPGTGRHERLQARRRRGIRHVIELDIWQQDLDAMVAAGEMEAADADNPESVADAVEDIFDRWINRTRPAPTGIPVPAAPVTVSVQPTMPAADDRRDGARRMELARRDGDDQRSNVERRPGIDRRQASAEWRELVGMERRANIERRVTPDRRQPSNRRDHADRRLDEERRIIS